MRIHRERGRAPRVGGVEAGRAFALVALVLLAGCTAPVAERPDPPRAAVPEEAPAGIELAILPRERSAAAPMEVAVALSERWLKPLRPLAAEASAPEGARVAWFVDLEEEEPRATVLEGEVYVLKATTPDRHHTQGPRAPLALVDVASDGRARALSAATPGRYVLDAGGARLVLNVWPEAPEGARQAFLVEEDGRLVFEPSEVDAPPRARVLVWNQAGRTVDVEEARYLAYVPLPAGGGRVTPVDEGLYAFHVLGVDARARGVGRAAFLVDFERPSDRLRVGPYEGEFAVAEARLETPRRIAFTAEHPLVSLEVRYAAASLVPVPASVVVALHGEDGVLAEASSLTGGSFSLGDLPAGEYVVEVRPEHGTRVGWSVELDGRYRSPLPERLESRT